MGFVVLKEIETEVLKDIKIQVEVRFAFRGSNVLHVLSGCRKGNFKKKKTVLEYLKKKNCIRVCLKMFGGWVCNNVMELI